MRALDDMENANAQVEISVEEVTKARTQKIKVVYLLIFYDSIIHSPFRVVALWNLNECLFCYICL
jgi:hypothetical protein